MKIVNLETITDMQSWYRTWPPNGPSRIRAKQKLRRKHKGACKKSWGQMGSLKSFALTIPWTFGKACEDLSWNHCTSTPHRSETNGIAERAAVRRVKEGTSAVLLQSGLDENVWADSMECYCCLLNIQDLLADTKTPYERRFGMPFDGPEIPFGAMVEYHPISAKDQSRLHQFGAKVLPGTFLGYARYAARIWKGDIMVADIQELDEMDASELYARRLNAKEVSTPQRRGNFIFPVADGTVKILWERTASENIHQLKSAHTCGSHVGRPPSVQESFITQVQTVGFPTMEQPFAHETSFIRTVNAHVHNVL